MAALARDHAFSRAAGASLARPAGCLLAHLRQRCTLVPPVGPEGVPIRATRAPFVSRAKRPWEDALPVRDPRIDNPEHDKFVDWVSGTSDVADEASAGRPVDLYRDTPVRYCGYANELGEAFAAWLPPGGVPLSYAVAIGYVLADTLDKTKLAYREAGRQLGQTAGTTKPGLQRLAAGAVAVDTLLWQLAASVALPGFTIHMVVHFATEALQAGSDEVLKAYEALHAPGATAAPWALSDAVDVLHGVITDPATGPLLLKTVPTLTGLAAIPLIVHPIDAFVHLLLNRTLRPRERDVVCDAARLEGASLAMCDVPVDRGFEHEWSKTMLAAAESEDEPGAATARGGVRGDASADDSAPTRPEDSAVGSRDWMDRRREEVLAELDESDASAEQRADPGKRKPGAFSLPKDLRKQILGGSDMRGLADIERGPDM